MSLEFKSFRFWCQKVLPTVYDDSLSYYELLCKLVAKLDEVMSSTSGAFNQLEENFESLKKEFEELRDSVEKFTSEIEFQKYVDNYIDKLLKNRDIDKLIADFLADNYNMNFLDVADLEIYAQHFAEDKVLRSSQGMDIGVINGVPYMACCLAGSEAENLIPLPYYDGTLKSVGGVTTTVGENGWLHVFGKATKSTNTFDIVYRNVEYPAGTYTISGVPVGASATTFRAWLGVYESGTLTQILSTQIYNEGFTFTVDKPFTIIYRVTVLEGTTLDVVYKPMLEVGRVAHPYVKHGTYIQPQFTIYNMNTGERVYTAHDNLLGHMNDVCFCSLDNSWYITGDTYSRYYTRFNLEAGTLEHILCPITTFNYIHGIAYNESDNLFYLYANTDDGNVLCKVNYNLNTVISTVNYSNPNYSNRADQGLYFDGVFLYKLNGRTTRDSKYSVFNHIEIYTSDMVYVKTINAPYSLEIEAMSFYDGKYYFSYNCYSRCGLIFKGDIYSTNNSYHTRDSRLTPIGVERFATEYTAYVANYDVAGYFCDNTSEFPFCHVWCGCAYLTDTNKTYATFNLISDVDCEFVCYGQTFTNLHIIGNNHKWNGYIRVESLNNFECENLTIVANNSWCLYISGVPYVELSSVSYNTNGFNTAINCYDCNITFNGDYYNTATESFINSNRLVNLRFNAMPTSGATTFGCSTYAMTVHDIKAHAVCGYSLYDTTLNSDDNVKDIWRNGTFIIQNDNVPIGAYANRNGVIIATNIGGSGTKLEWFDRTRLNTQKDIAVAYRIVDHVTGFDSGWIDIKRGYNLLSEKDVTFYIDSETGSDNNDGSREKPFATFNRFALEYTRYSELRCSFIGNGTYYESTNIETFNACSIHILNESNNANVTLSIKGVHSPAFYNSQLNVGGTASKRITLDIPNGLYFDGGDYIMKYTDITNGNLSVNGGHAIHTNCVFTNCRLRVSGGTLSLANVIFNGDITSCIAGIQGAVIKISNTFECNANISGDLGAIYAVNCTLYLSTILTNTSQQKGLYCDDSIILSMDQNFNTWNVNDSHLRFCARLGEQYNWLG